MDATALEGLVTRPANDAHAPLPERTDPQDGKLALHHSAMLVVLGSGGCWFLLTAFVRWTFF